MGTTCVHHAAHHVVNNTTPTSIPSSTPTVLHHSTSSSKIVIKFNNDEPQTLPNADVVETGPVATSCSNQLHRTNSVHTTITKLEIDSNNNTTITMESTTITTTSSPITFNNSVCVLCSVARKLMNVKQTTPEIVDEAAEIIPGLLWLSSKKWAQELEWLKSHNILMVLNAAAEIPNFYQDNESLSYCRLELEDDGSEVTIVLLFFCTDLAGFTLPP